MVRVISKALLFILFLASCKGNNPKREVKENILEDKYSYEIYSKLVKTYKYLDYVHLIPPPPQEYTIDFTEEDFLKQRDSLIALHKDSLLKIAVYPILFKIEDNEKTNLKDTVFMKLYKRLKKIREAPIDISKIGYDKNKIRLSLLDTLRNDKNWENRFKTNDIILSFSRVVFTDDFTRALLVSGVTTSKVDAFSSVIQLRRERGTWIGVNNLDKKTSAIYDLIKGDK